MVLRLKMRLGPSGDRRLRLIASKAAVFLTPAALCALLLACWRLGADLGWTGEFAISSGLFSHWQVWMAAAAALQVCASSLNRFATRGKARAAAPAAAPPPAPLVRRPVSSSPGVRPRSVSGTYPVKDRTYF